MPRADGHGPLAVFLFLALLAGQLLLGGRPDWAALALFLALLPAAGTVFAARPPALTTTGRGWALLALSALALVQIWRLPTLQARGWTVLGCGLLALTITVVIADDRRLGQRLVFALVALGAAQALIGLGQAAGGFGVPVGAGEVIPQATGTFTNRNHLAGFLNLALALGLGLLEATFSQSERLRRMERLAKTWLLVLLCTLLGLGVLMTRSRAGLLVLILTVALVGALLFLRRRRGRKGLPGMLAWIILAGVFVLAVAFGLEGITHRFRELGTSGRPIIYADTLDLIAAHWPLGVGAGMYRWAFRPFQTIDLEHWYTHAHNDYLETAADLGVPLAVLLWGFVFWRLARAGRLAVTAESAAARGLALGSAGAIFSLALHALVDFNFHIPANLVALAIAIGVAWGLEPGRGAPAALPRAGSTLVFVALFALLMAAAWTTARRFSAAAYTRFPRGTADLELAVRHMPDSPESHLALGRRLRDSPADRDPRRAAFHLERAAALNPSSWQSHWELAQLREIAGRHREAGDAFAAAIAINPRDGRYRWRYANFLLRRGEREKMLPEVRAALEASPRLTGAAWNLLVASGATGDELDRAWPPGPSARLDLLRLAVSDSAGEYGPFLAAQWSEILASDEIPGVPAGAFYPAWLLRQGQALDARRQWIALAAANERSDPAYESAEQAVWNGGFEDEISGPPFGWRLINAPGFSVERAESFGADGSSALYLELDGGENIDRVFAYQLVTLDPGAIYRFSYQIRSKGITTDQGITVELVRRGTNIPFFEGPMVLGDTPWQNHQHLVTSPPETSLIEVRLRRRKSLRLDGRVEGRLWLDRLRLERFDP